MTPFELLRRLKTATWTCHSCGSRWGVPRPGNSTWHYGQCDVCDCTAPVTEARHYSYFITGIRQLRGEKLDHSRIVP